MGIKQMARSRNASEVKASDAQKPGAAPPAPSEMEAAGKKQIWVYLQDARDVGLLTNYLGKAQPDVFAEVLRKTLRNRVKLEQVKRDEEEPAE